MIAGTGFGAAAIADGDADEGSIVFTKLRCDVCHSVNSKPAGAPHPLPDLSAEAEGGRRKAQGARRK